MIDRAAELVLLGCIPMRNTTCGGPRVVAPYPGKILARYLYSWEVWEGATMPEYVPAEWADMKLETVPDETYETFLEAIQP